MKIPPFASVLCVLLVVLVVGCQSPRAARIQENAALFASLDPFTRKLVSDGLFDYGFTPELLYMSMGKPNQIAAVETTDGTLITWKYRNYLYGGANAVKFGINNPGGRSSQPPIISSSAPGGPSLSSTKSSPVQPTVPDVNDVPLGTLYLDLLNDRVVAARLKP